MERNEIANFQDAQIQRLLGGFLPARSSFESSPPTGERHLDEDSLAAFVEGNLNRRQSQPIVSHLVDCSFCRHITAELVKLDYAFAEIDENQTVNIARESEPAKISDVLNGLLSRLFGASDNAVFAHNETEEDAEDLKTSKEDK